jgi:hypothetical protein
VQESEFKLLTKGTFHPWQAKKEPATESETLEQRQSTSRNHLFTQAAGVASGRFVGIYSFYLQFLLVL